MSDFAVSFDKRMYEASDTQNTEMRQMENYEKTFSLVILLALLLYAALPTVAAKVDESGVTPLFVGPDNREIELSELPTVPYYENGIPMIPLRAVAEALGYKVSWDSETGDITVDDDYIQAVTLRGGSDEAVFSVHLKVIDMSRDSKLELPLNIIDGTSYVPASFFEEFFNEVKIENGKISVAPVVYTLD